MNDRVDKFFIDIALKIAKKSPANKRKVGALIINSDTGELLATGNNRMFDTCSKSCENSKGESFDYVIHAEEDAIIDYLKNYKHKIPVNKTIYVTYSPCINCCKLIVLAGIARVVYSSEHPKNFITAITEEGFSPKEFLEKNNIMVDFYNEPEKIEDKNHIALIYHSKDNDGFMSAYLMEIMFKYQLDNGDAKLYPYNYESEADWMTNPNINHYLFIDVTPDEKWYNDKCNSIGDFEINIYDHHISKKDMVMSIADDRVNYWFDEHQAGCELFFGFNKQLFRKNLSINYFNVIEECVRIFGRFDTWSFTKYNEAGKNIILAFQTYFETYNDYETFKKEFSSLNIMSDIGDVIKYGELHIDKIKINNLMLIDNGKYSNELKTLIYNGYPNYWLKEQANNVIGKPIDFYIGYRIDLKENKMSFSIRSETESVLPIAKKFSGGGHNLAGGFRVDIKTGFQILGNPKILFPES